MNGYPTRTLDRSTPPPAGRPKDVRFPDFFESKLGNGLNVLIYERTEFPIAYINIVFRGGSMLDGGIPGLASMTGELMTKGTPSRNAEQIVEEVESLGGSIGAGSGWDSSSIGVTILSKHLDRAMEIAADVARESTFPEEELERARAQRLASIMQKKSHPGSLAFMRFMEGLYGAHPYGSPSDGTEESLQSLAREDLIGFHRRIYVPRGAFIVAVGDVSPDHFLPKMESLFGSWQIEAPVADQPAEPTGAEARLVQIVDRPSSVQSSILVGQVGIPRSDPEYITLSVMNTLFGGYFGSRLNLNLREDKGYTYGAHSRLDARLQAGPFSAGVEVRTEVTAEAIDEILREFDRLRAEDVGEAELDGVKRFVTGNFPIQIETPAQVAQRIIAMELYGLGREYFNTYNSRVLAVTAGDIRRAAARIVHPERLVIAVAGKGDDLRGALARFGRIEMFTPDGDPIPTS